MTPRAPDSLTELSQWLVWKYETQSGRKDPTKVPYQVPGANGELFLASSTSPETWAEFGEAVSGYTHNPDLVDGIGFVFCSSDPYCGIDVDRCLTPDGSVKDWAKPILSRFSDTYAEISPSGKGVKIWVKAKLPGKGVAYEIGDGRIEIYDQSRYFTVTGNHWGGQFRDIEEHQADIDWLLTQSPHGQRKVPQNIADNTEGKIPKGRQYDSLVSLAGSLRARGAGLETVNAALQAMNRDQCTEPGTEADIRKIAENSMRWPAGRTNYPPPPNGHAASQVNGSDVTAPEEAPSDAREAPLSKRDLIEIAEGMVDAVIATGQCSNCYGTVKGPPDYLVALAPCGDVAHGRAKAKFQAAFPKEFRSDRWTTELKEQIHLHDERQREAQPKREGWESQLILKPSFMPAPCVTNALLYFNHHPDWHGKLAWNEFTSEPLVRGELPAPVNLHPGEAVKDHHDTLVQSWLERATNDANWKIDTVRRAVDCWAKSNSFHPVKDYLDSLPKWDGEERLPSWLYRYCGGGPSEIDDPEGFERVREFISAIGVRWWISAIARIYQPGCEVHHVLVLEGAKGLGKSTLVRTIFGEWSGFITGDVATKDSQALLSSGVWGLELDELGILDKSSMRSVKSWVTRPFEKFRPTWGHRHEKRPRQVVFLATVDRTDWADEEDRRWWPVLCQRPFDLDGLKRDRDQLMAEALFRYRRGDRWHFDREEDAALISTAQQEQAARVPEDTWAGQVKKAAEAARMKAERKRIGTRDGYFVSKEEILDHLPERLQTNRDQAGNRIGRAMKNAPGWVKIQVYIDGERLWRYFWAPGQGGLNFS